MVLPRKDESARAGMTRPPSSTYRRASPKSMTCHIPVGKLMMSQCQFACRHQEQPRLNSSAITISPCVQLGGVCIRSVHMMAPTQMRRLTFMHGSVAGRDGKVCGLDVPVDEAQLVHACMSASRRC